MVNFVYYDLQARRQAIQRANINLRFRKTGNLAMESNSIPTFTFKPAVMKD